uniref:Uncharacterized protein n=1 Tax=Candidatus Kentrum sp. DK TaxID=2126562 RepID=A0A450SL88_9GAMM|nr:MAG: hypothetical protein BECKDK2373B_GA0170837_104629 [Candidatus Kentron sp. DK]
MALSSMVKRIEKQGIVSPRWVLWQRFCRVLSGFIATGADEEGICGMWRQSGDEEGGSSFRDLPGILNRAIPDTVSWAVPVTVVRDAIFVFSDP